MIWGRVLPDLPKKFMSLMLKGLVPAVMFLEVKVFFAVPKKAQEIIEASMGFEPMTSAILV